MKAKYTLTKFLHLIEREANFVQRNQKVKPVPFSLKLPQSVRILQTGVKSISLQELMGCLCFDFIFENVLQAKNIT